MKKETNPWMIISFALIILLIISWTIIGLILSWGNSIAENEAKCSNSICGPLENADSFLYDDYSNTCYCYSNGLIILEKEIKK